MRPYLTSCNFDLVDQNEKILFELHSRGQRLVMFQIWAYDESVWLVFKHDSKCNLWCFTGVKKCRLISTPVRNVITLNPWFFEPNGSTTVFYSENSLSVPVCKCWWIRLHTFPGPFHLQKSLFCQYSYLCKSKYPTLSAPQMCPVIHHEPKPQIYTLLVTINICPSFRPTKC